MEILRKEFKIMNHSKIGTVESIMLILCIIIIHTVLSLPKILLNNTKSATILNIIYVTIIALFLIFLICHLFKKFPGMDILDISEFLGGKFFRNILGTIFIIYFVISSSIFLRNFCECLKIVYYPSTSIIFVILFFIGAVCITNHLEFNATLKANLLIIPIVLVSIIFLFCLNFRNFTPQRVFPLLGNGFFSTFVTGIGNIASFNGIVFLYFLPPLLKETNKFKKISILSIIISAVYLILSVSIILFMFNFFISTDEIMPLYTAATYIEFGTFFQRLESVFLLIWMIAFACYLSIVSKFAIHIFKKISSIKDIKPIIYPFCLIMLGIALFPKNYAISKFYEVNIYPYLVLGFVFVSCILILVFANLKKRKKVGEVNE